jgi:DNA polymerase-3 subunit alpha
MGSSSVAAIVEARRSGKFTSLFDFCARLGSGAVNRRGLESLIAAGAFDSLDQNGSPVGEWRSRLNAAIDPALQQGQRAAEDRLRGQSGLFAAADGDGSSGEQTLPDAPAWSQAEIAKREKAAVGFYLSAHPLDNYADVLASQKLRNIAEIDEPRSGETVTLAGMIGALQIRTSKKGNRFATFRLEDRSGGIKCLVIGENFNRLAASLKDDEMFIAEGRIEAAEGQEPTLMINELRSLDEAVAGGARELNIHLPNGAGDEAYLEGLYNLLERDRGRCGVFLTMDAGDATVRLQAEGLSVFGSRSLQRDLEERGCSVEWVH